MTPVSDTCTSHSSCTRHVRTRAMPARNSKNKKAKSSKVQTQKTSLLFVQELKQRIHHTNLAV